MIVKPEGAEAAPATSARARSAPGRCASWSRAQERIVDRFPNPGCGRIHLNRVTYLPIPDNTVRLQPAIGAVEFGERMEPDDLRAIQRNRNLRGVPVDELGYQGLTINIGNGARGNTPMGRDARVRQAFELSLDRTAINQVVYEGMYTPTRQPVPPASPFHLRDFQPEPRNVPRARELLRAAGHAGPVPVELLVPNNPDLRQVGEVIQAMARESGFEVTIRASEFASALQGAVRGEFEVFLLGWSGRTDPDGNIFAFTHSTGGQNDGRYANPEVDRLLEQARAESDVERRRALYRQVADISLAQDRHRIYLWHRKNVMIHSTRLTGYQPNPDGMIRLQGMRLN